MVSHGAEAPPETQRRPRAVTEFEQSKQETWVRAAAVGVLLGTLLIALAWSHNRQLWVDELLELYTDSQPSVGRIVWMQLHAPASFDPPAFHVLLHPLLRVFSSTEFALRVVSMVSLLVTQGCAYLLTRDLLRPGLRSAMAGLLAMVLPFFLCSVDYAPEARVYSLLLALTAVSLLAYQRALAARAGEYRWHALLGVCCGSAVLMHYFAILAVLPLWLAEMVRYGQRRLVDRRMLAALLLGTLCVLLNLPFAHGLSAIRATYYNNGETSWWMVPFTFLWFKYHFAIYPLAFFHLHRTHLLGLLATAVVVAAALSALVRSTREELPVRVALAAVALLPFWSLVLAQVAKAYVPRYSLPAIFGISVLGALFLAEVLSARWLGVLAAALVLWGCGYSYGQMRMFRSWKLRTEHSVLSAGQLAVLRSLPDQHIYVQDAAKYLVLHRYRPEPFLGVNSGACEMFWSRRNTDSVITSNLQRMAGVPFVPFRQMRARPEPHLLLLFGDPDNEWISRQLHAEGAEVRPLGGAFEGQLVLVRLHGRSCD